MDKLPHRIQGMMEEGYLWQDELVFGQCDFALNIRISSLLEHLVTVSSQHIRTFGMTYQAFLASDTAFVLTRTTLTIHQMPQCFQLLNLKTWIDGIKGPYYQRVTQWCDENDNVMVSGRSDWVIIQPSTRSLLKPDKTDQRFTIKSPVELPPCQRVKWGDLALTPLGEHPVVWSEIDGNGHLHSSHYGDIIWDFLPSKFQKSIPTSFTMEYQKEGFLGDVISVSGGEASPFHYYVMGESQGAPCFKASIQFAETP